MTSLTQLFESLSPPEAARRLLGCEFVRTIDGREARVRIVETEAYHQSDAASHSYNGRTQRTDVMFGPAAHLYVYFTYGMHYCCNVVSGPVGTGAGTLIRAVEPVEGTELLQRNRDRSGIDLTNGPAKLCQAMAIRREMNGHDLEQAPLRLVLNPALENDQIVESTRVGISKAVDVPWRFYVKDNPYVSKS